MLYYIHNTRSYIMMIYKMFCGIYIYSGLVYASRRVYENMYIINASSSYSTIVK